MKMPLGFSSYPCSAGAYCARQGGREELQSIPGCMGRVCCNKPPEGYWIVGLLHTFTESEVRTLFNTSIDVRHIRDAACPGGDDALGALM
jgi:hypothetical protein